VRYEDEQHSRKLQWVDLIDVNFEMLKQKVDFDNNDALGKEPEDRKRAARPSPQKSYNCAAKRQKFSANDDDDESPLEKDEDDKKLDGPSGLALKSEPTRNEEQGNGNDSDSDDGLEFETESVEEEMAPPSSSSQPPVVRREDHCSICSKTTMINPRALPCHHLFCQACIERRFDTDQTCPDCRFPMKTLDLLDETSSPDSFRQVECINMVSGKVVQEYCSASSASKAVVVCSALQIVTACQSRQHDEKKRCGFDWRFVGTNNRILKEGEKITDGLAIEQICLKTTRVLATFPSINSASKTTGINRRVVSRVLERRGVANGGGFFWRYAGETHGPWENPPRKKNAAVEQLELETGRVIAEFDSLADAKSAMNVKQNTSGGIRETCDGKRVSAKGYYWRWKGSSEISNEPKSIGKRVQLRESQSGSVVRQFNSAKAAADWIGSDFSTVCAWCRKEKKAKGYYWSYAPTGLRQEGRAS